MGKVRLDLSALCSWTVRYDFAIVVVLSAVHIGLSYMHSRKSATLNQFTGRKTGAENGSGPITPFVENRKREKTENV
jgi:hypothetical protein